jgi:hypothetical protein
MDYLSTEFVSIQYFMTSYDEADPDKSTEMLGSAWKSLVKARYAPRFSSARRRSSPWFHARVREFSGVYGRMRVCIGYRMLCGACIRGTVSYTS